VLRGQRHTGTAHLAGDKWPPFRPTIETLYTQTSAGAQDECRSERQAEDKAPIPLRNPLTALGREVGENER